ncbi:hypothetical protein A2U01_0005327, partial [Trifolium medium]|nr:hypothetical protein [Trifolium medium]
MASSSNPFELAAMESPKEQQQYCFQEFESFGNKELEETYQQLLVNTRSIEPHEPKNDVHVQNNLMEQLIKENQRLSKKIEDMNATQTKMMHILVELKNSQFHGTVEPRVAGETLGKNNDVPLMLEPIVNTTIEVGKTNVNLTKKLPSLKGISSIIIGHEEDDVADKEEFGSTVCQVGGKMISTEYQRTRAMRMKMSDIVGPNVQKKLAFTPSPSSFKRSLPPTQLNKRPETPFRTPGSTSKSYKLSLNEATLPK